MPKNSAGSNINNIPSKFQVDQDVWVKIDPNTKWMAGKITQILPNQKLHDKALRGLYLPQESAPYHKKAELS